MPYKQVDKWPVASLKNISYKKTETMADTLILISLLGDTIYPSTATAILLWLSLDELMYSWRLRNSGISAILEAP